MSDDSESEPEPDPVAADREGPRLMPEEERNCVGGAFSSRVERIAGGLGLVFAVIGDEKALAARLTGMLRSVRSSLSDGDEDRFRDKVGATGDPLVPTFDVLDLERNPAWNLLGLPPIWSVDISGTGIDEGLVCRTLGESMWLRYDGTVGGSGRGASLSGEVMVVSDGDGNF